MPNEPAQVPSVKVIHEADVMSRMIGAVALCAAVMALMMSFMAAMDAESTYNMVEDRMCVCERVTTASCKEDEPVDGLACYCNDDADVPLKVFIQR